MPRLCIAACALAIFALSPTRFIAAAQTERFNPGSAPAPQVAADEPRLPEASPPVAPLRRGLNGEIEVISPKTQSGGGPRLCEANSICVGKDQGFGSVAAALAAARDGDLIEIVAGTYHEAVKIGLKNVTLRGVAGTPHFDCAGLHLPEDKACLLLAAAGITLENLEISGAELPESLGANGACIRNETNLSFTLKRIYCHGSQEGVLASGGSISIEDSQFYDNGWTGQTHNVYFSGDCVVTVRGSVFRDARVGHEFKSRCRKTEISDSTFDSTKGSRDLDLPDGGEVLVYRSTIVKAAGAASEEVIGFTAESCRYSGDMQVKAVRIVNSHANADIRNYDKCVGHPIVLDEVASQGIPIRDFGYVVHR